jgi:sugar/nucleoside kinase (ribokinase family)
MALTWTTGRRTLVTNSGANGRLRLHDIPAGMMRGAQHVHRAGYWWTTGLVGKPTVTLLARAHRLGATTSLDVSTDPQGWPKSRIEAVRMCLPHVDMFFGNETEVCAVAGERSPLRAGKRLRSLGPEEVIVHTGDQGSSAVTSSGVLNSPAFEVPIDNPTGCGDVFNAAYVYAKLTGNALKESLRFANASAALHLRNRRRPYPNVTEVRRFLREFARR